MSDGGDDDELNINYLEMKDRSSQTALHHACYGGHVRVVQALLDAGAEVETKTSKSYTPILIAASKGYLDIVQYLVEHIDELDLTGKLNKQKKNPLIMACQHGHLDVVKYLTPHHIDLNVPDTSGNTPLHYAAAYGWSYIVDYLLKNGAEINIKNLWNSSPASIALQKGHYLNLDIFIQNFKGTSEELVQDA